MNEEFYYSSDKLLTYGCLFNLIIGERGNGKTFEFKRLCIKDYIKKKEQFIWIRRYESELDDIDQFFKDINKLFPDSKFMVKGHKFYCNDEIMGFYLPLSKGVTKKSNVYEKVTKIVFDEFLVAKSNYHYLKNEVMAFLDLYETIARLRDVKVYLIANAISEINPYFIFFNIRLSGNRFTKIKDDVILEVTDTKDYRQVKRKSRFGKLINGTGYDRYSIDNEFTNDNHSFIEQKSSKARIIFNLKYNNFMIGIWVDNENGKLYCSSKINPNIPIYCIVTEDMQPNYLILKSTSNYMKLLRNSYEYGFIYYENIKIKGVMNEIKRYLNIK